MKIRRGRPGLEGQQTDIYVDAVSASAGTGKHARFSLVVEAKGCWHDEVRSAMKTQLVDRYLEDNKCTHGLYLVGWFKDDAWSAKDGRKAQAQGNFPGSLDDARAELTAQSKELTRDGKVVSSVILDARLKPT